MQHIKVNMRKPGFSDWTLWKQLSKREIRASEGTDHRW